MGHYFLDRQYINFWRTVNYHDQNNLSIDIAHANIWIRVKTNIELKNIPDPGPTKTPGSASLCITLIYTVLAVMYA